MNIVLPQKINVDQFLAWAEQQSEGRYELVRGKVVMMAPERIRHVRTKAKIYLVLLQAAEQAGCDAEVFADGVGVKIGEHLLREPDVSIQLGRNANPDSLVLDKPVVVVEVLSPSSVAIDTIEKLEEYFSVSTIEHYLIVEAEKCAVIHHRRNSVGQVETVVLHSGSVAFTSLGFSVDVASFFGEVAQ